MRRFWLLTGLLFAALLVVFGAVQALGVPLLTDPSPWLRRGGPLAAGLGVGLLVADVLLPVPSSLVMMAHGAIFGVLVGTLLSLAGGVGAALAGFAVGRRGGRLVARLVPPEERRQAYGLLQRWGPLAIVVSRPLPLLADTVVIVAGASPLSARRAMLAAAAGSLLPAMLYALAGATAATFSNLALTFGLVLLLAALFWWAGGWAQRLLARAAESHPATPRRRCRRRKTRGRR